MRVCGVPQRAAGDARTRVCGAARAALGAGGDLPGRRLTKTLKTSSKSANQQIIQRLQQP
eukprot:scaffold69789_cov48-Phaeocystis_antarctica.AAC.1